MIRPADASQNLDERYWHDGVNQLIHMQRSNLDFTADPANPTIDNENLAQQWDLDATGNWSSATTDGDEQRELCRGRRPKTTRIHCGEKRDFLGESADATSSVATGYRPPPPERHIPLRKS